MFFFISDQFCISFRLIIPIICLYLPLISAYFALDNPAACKNIFSVLFLILLANKIPFSLNLILFFFQIYQQSINLSILYFLNFNLYFNWVDFFSIFKSLLSPHYIKLRTFMFFSLLLVFVINILCIFLSSAIKF